MVTFEELKGIADSMGISYSPNIKFETLCKRVEDAQGFAFEDDEAQTENENLTEDTVEKPKKAKKTVQEIIKENERKNKQTKIVRITMVDKREASTATNAFFSNGNIQMDIPLDTFVEMPVVLIKQAEDAKAVIHVKVGDKTQKKLVKKYVVEYK